MVYQVRTAVVAARPPIIVRTEPPPKKRDVPLNLSMVVVFSEPIDSATLTPASVRLLRNGRGVSGSVRVLDVAHVKAAFVPDAPLSAQTDYQLLVSQTVRDRDGQALAEAETVPFTTGSSLTGPPVSISFSVDSGMALLVGASFQMTATVRDAAGNELTDQMVNWFTTDSSVLTVSATGLVTAVGDGIALVGASAGAVSNQTSFHVTGLPAASVTIAPNTTTVGTGDTVMVTATARDSTGRVINHPSVTWTSSAPALATIATVGSDQRIATVTAVSLGSVTITASSGTGSATAEITIGPQVPVASVTVTPPVASVVVQGSVQLAATLRDANGKVLLARPTAWTSDNGTIAAVDAYGLVTAVRAGSATVTATSGAASGTATVIVSPQVPVASVTVTPVSASLVVQGTVQLSVTLRDASGTVLAPRPTIWISHDEAVARVDANGLVTAVGPGSVAVTATSEGQTGIASIAVTVLTFTALAGGEEYTCGLASGTGAAFCWGRNDYGQLGDGTQTSRLAPVQVGVGVAG
ncbi:MAG TPA: Ig-like domain-containing protein, partial [Gemmatimonadales bacterium]